MFLNKVKKKKSITQHRMDSKRIHKEVVAFSIQNSWAFVGSHHSGNVILLHPRDVPSCPLEQHSLWDAIGLTLPDFWKALKTYFFLQGYSQGVVWSCWIYFSQHFMFLYLPCLVFIISLPYHFTCYCYLFLLYATFSCVPSRCYINQIDG